MSRSSHTKDEQFLICLSTMSGGEQEVPLDRYLVGREAGLEFRAVNAICALLIRANFIKKASEQEICITPHGAALAQQLIQKKRSL